MSLSTKTAAPLTRANGSPERPLRAYMLWAGPDPEDGAALVFAHSIKEAKRLGADTVLDWCPDCEYTDVRARWLRETKGTRYLRELLKPTKPCVFDAPPMCESCEVWSGVYWEQIDGERFLRCDFCGHDSEPLPA